MSSNYCKTAWENDREPDVIEAVMYIALGFCTAGLIGLAILPAFYRRAARLTEEALRAVNPSSYAEVRAAQDQARARHAIELRRVERQLDDERAKAAKHHLEAARLRTEIDELNRSHRSQVAGLETKLGSLHGDQNAVDLLTSEVKALKEKLADSEKALAESWKQPLEESRIEPGTRDRSKDDGDWLPAADTMALATITGLEAEVATLKSRLAKHEPLVAAEIEASDTKGEKSRLAELEAQLVDTESKYVSAQAEVTRLSLLLGNEDTRETKGQTDLTEQIEELTQKNTQQRSDLLNKERALERASGQIEKLKTDLANAPALSQLREEFRSLASKLAGPDEVSADNLKAQPADAVEQSVTTPGNASAKSVEDPAPAPRRGKRTQRIVVPGDKIGKPATIKIKTAKVSTGGDKAEPAKSTDIASAAEALVSRVVASNRKMAQEGEEAKSADAPNPETSTGTEPDAGAPAKTTKQKKKDVA